MMYESLDTAQLPAQPRKLSWLCFKQRRGVPNQYPLAGDRVHNRRSECSPVSRNQSFVEVSATPRSAAECLGAVFLQQSIKGGSIYEPALKCTNRHHISANPKMLGGEPNGIRQRNVCGPNRSKLSGRNQDLSCDLVAKDLNGIRSLRNVAGYSAVAAPDMS